MRKNLPCSPAINAEALQYGHTHLEEKDEEEHKEVEGTVTPENSTETCHTRITALSCYNSHMIITPLALLITH